MTGFGLIRSDWFLLTRDRRPSQAGVEECDRSLEEEVLQLYDRYAEPLARYVSGVTSDSDLAGEIVQECFLRYVSLRRAGEDAISEPAWFFGEVRAQIEREQRRKDEEATILESRGTAVPATNPAPAPDQMCLTGEIRQIAASVASPRELDCLFLRGEGLGYEEIADVMKITSGAVGAMLARAVRKVQAIVHERGGWPKGEP